LCPVSLPETKLNAVWEKTASDVSAWQDATCVGCMVSSAANYDPTASYDAGCWPSLTSTISSGQTVTGEVTNAALPSAYRYYEFTMAPGDRIIFSTCGLPRSNDNMLTMLFITTQNGTQVSSIKSSHITSGFGPARGGECGPVLQSYTNTAAEVSVGEADTADLCTDPDPVTGLCTFNVVVRPWSPQRRSTTQAPTISGCCALAAQITPRTTITTRRASTPCPTAPACTPTTPTASERGRIATPRAPT
jgi:hypothetical protein